MTSARSKFFAQALFEAMRQLTNIANILIYHDNCCKIFLKISYNGNTMINSTYRLIPIPIHYCVGARSPMSLYQFTLNLISGTNLYVLF